ncbi:MAG: hypothetical protein RL095_1109 [Verrucomicrobiota bacterium]|jgi:hypothetical protein
MKSQTGNSNRKLKKWLLAFLLSLSPCLLSQTSANKQDNPDELREKLITEYLNGDAVSKVFAQAELCRIRPKIQDYLIDHLDDKDKNISELCKKIMTYDNPGCQYIFDQEIPSFELNKEPLDLAISKIIKSARSIDPEKRGLSYLMVQDITDKSSKISIEKQSGSFVKLLKSILVNTGMRFLIHNGTLEIYSLQMPREEKFNEKLFLEVKERIKIIISTQDVLAADREPVKWIEENRDKIEEYLFMFKSSGIPRIESVISGGRGGCNMSSRVPYIKFEDAKLEDILEDLAKKMQASDPDKKIIKWNIDGDRKSFVEPLMSGELNDLSIYEFMDIICRANRATWRAEDCLVVTRQPIAEEIIKSQKIKIENFEKELLQASNLGPKIRRNFKGACSQINLVKKHLNDPDPEIQALCKDIIDAWYTILRSAPE